MARRAVFRSRISPKSALAEQPHELASIFIDRVGKLIYDNDWTENDHSKLNHRDVTYRAGSGEDLASTVRNQVLSGLRRRVFDAFVFIIAPALKQARTSPNSLLQQDDLEDESLEAPDDEEIDPLWGEDGQPRLRQLAINPDYWLLPDEDLKIDWISSKITISTQHLSDTSWMPRRHLPVGEIYQVSARQIEIPLHISFPQEALRNLVIYEDIPGQEWIDRYKIYREKGRAEIPAVMWRYISLKGYSTDNPPSAKELSEISLDYLRGQGLMPPADR